MQTKTNTLRLRSVLRFAAFLLLFSSSCGKQRLKVIYMPAPTYPFEARSEGMQGIVVVTAGIGTDGKVTNVIGKGSNPPLVQAAEENAKAWIFEVPAHARFPIKHQIKYTFTFYKEGGANLVPKIVTDLPDAVQIIATPAGGDKVILIPSGPPANSQR